MRIDTLLIERVQEGADSFVRVVITDHRGIVTTALCSAWSTLDASAELEEVRDVSGPESPSFFHGSTPKRLTINFEGNILEGEMAKPKG